LFTAKEAFYKCQYPLVGEWLDFHDVIIAVDAWSGRGGTFTARGARVLRVAGHIALPIGGRYLVHDGFLTAAVSVPAPGELRPQ
jgi:4'-phosphopantetheinyl transferase EntD